MRSELKTFVERISYLIPHIQRGIFKKMSKGLGISELTFPQMVVLELVRQKGSSKMKDVAESLSVTTSAATGIVDRMVKGRLLERVFDPGDRRIIYIKMTEKGKEMVDRIGRKRTDMLAAIFGKLGKKERDAYIAILEKIYNILSEKEK